MQTLQNRTQLRHAPPPRSGAVRAYLEKIGDGDHGIERTVELMTALIRDGIRHPLVRAHAERAVATVQPGDAFGEIDALRSYIGPRVRYRRDPIDVELLRTPWFIVEEIDAGRIPQLDCDDLTILSLALLGAVGFPTAIRVVSTRPTKEYNHVFGMVRVRGDWYALDLTKAWLPKGYAGPQVTRYFDTEV